MPPKPKFTREQVVEAALDLVRRQGMPALTARALAGELHCSVKPIFGLFPNMEAVQREVLRRADDLYQSFLVEDMAAGNYPPYKASGMAYIRFARQEPLLFQLLFMRDRRAEELSASAEVEPLYALIQKNLGITRAQAERFHLEMWLFVHGIATMVATNYLPWEDSFISDCLTDAYQGLAKRYREG